MGCKRVVAYTAYTGVSHIFVFLSFFITNPNLTAWGFVLSFNLKSVVFETGMVGERRELHGESERQWRWEGGEGEMPSSVSRAE